MVAPAVGGERERAIRSEVRDELRTLLDAEALLVPGPAEHEQVERLVSERIAAANRRSATLGEPALVEPERLARRILDDLLGLGPLQPLLDDPEVEEIIVNGPQRIFAIAGGSKRLTDVVFEDDEQLLALLRRALGPLGRRLDETSPMVDARLADGSRLNAVMPPLASGGTHATIRKFLLRARTLEDLVSLEALTPEAAAFLEAAVRCGLNMLIAGGTGSGKTTCLNALGSSVSGSRSVSSPSRRRRSSSSSRCCRTAWRCRRGSPTPRAPAASRSARWSRTRCACGRRGSWWARSAAPRRWTCSPP